MLNLKKIVFSFSVLLSLALNGCFVPPVSPGSTPTVAPSSAPINLFGADNVVVNKNSDVKPIMLENNMARLAGVVVNVSSTYEGWPKERLNDGNLETSWFTANEDAANLGKSPFVEYVFPQPVSVKGVNLRGNREYKDGGYDFLEGILLLTDKFNNTIKYTVIFPPPDRDFDVSFKNELKNIVSMKIAFTKDISTEPGLSEIEVVGSK